MFKLFVGPHDPEEKAMDLTTERDTAVVNCSAIGVATARAFVFYYLADQDHQRHLILLAAKRLAMQVLPIELPCPEISPQWQLRSDHEQVQRDEDLIRDYYHSKVFVWDSLDLVDEQCTFNDFLSEVLRSVQSQRDENRSDQTRVWNSLEQFRARLRAFEPAGLLWRRNVDLGDAQSYLIDCDYLVWKTYRRMSPPERHLLAETFDRYGGWFTVALFLIDELHEAVQRNEAVEFESNSIDQHLFWTLKFSALLDIDVEIGDYPELPAFMIETAARTLICIDQGLSASESNFAVCHELAHRLLTHTANSEYGLVADSLTPARAKVFQQQEREADGIAAFMVHLTAELSAHLIHYVDSASLPIGSENCEELVDASCRAAA